MFVIYCCETAVFESIGKDTCRGGKRIEITRKAEVVSLKLL